MLKEERQGWRCEMRLESGGAELKVGGDGKTDLGSRVVAIVGGWIDWVY